MEDLRQDVKQLLRESAECKAMLHANTIILEHHIKRTEMNESRIEKLEYYLLGFFGTAILGILMKLFVLK